MPRPSKKKTQPKNQIYAALRYYRGPVWTPRRLRDKMGRQAMRMLAANLVYQEKSGEEVLSSTTKRVLSQLVPTKPRARIG